jgi:hypothetical protein
MDNSTINNNDPSLFPNRPDILHPFPPPIPSPIPPVPPVETHSWLMAMMHSLEDLSNAMNGQQLQDANLTNQAQTYQRNIAEWWQAFISKYTTQHASDLSNQNKAPGIQAQLNLFNTEQSTDGTTADGVTHALSSVMTNDGNALAKMMDFLQQATEVIGFTANTTRS